MPSLEFFRTGKLDFREPILPQAHFQEHQWVLRGVPWEAAAQQLAALFPKHTRRDRPRSWYALLRGTHWPGEAPPGNGPFYVPEWVWADLPKEEATSLEATLKGAGYRRIEAHVALLPQTKEYLVWAMRQATGLPWTANPRTYRAYYYPALRRDGKAPLRSYTTEPFRFR